MLQKKKQKRQPESNSGELVEKRSGNQQIMVVTYVFVFLFLAMIGYLVYFMVVQSKDVINNSYNQRQNLLAERTVRGKIITEDGEVLAETITDSSGKETRSYPYGRMFCHVVGHSTQGKTGIELMENFNLLTSNDNMFENFQKKLSGEKTIGDNAVTTLNVNYKKLPMMHWVITEGQWLFQNHLQEKYLLWFQNRITILLLVL